MLVELNLTQASRYQIINGESRGGDWDDLDCSLSLEEKEIDPFILVNLYISNYVPSNPNLLTTKIISSVFLNIVKIVILINR